MILEELTCAEGFTDAERRIADYVLANAEAVPAMDITALADAVPCAPATIVRLCQKLNAGGYRQFCLELAADLERRRAHGAVVDVDYPFASGQMSAEITESIASLMRRAIDVCAEELDVETVESIARNIRDAEHVLLYGVGESLLKVTLFANMLISLGITCTIADSYGERVASTMAAKSNDIAIVVSYTGRTLAFNHMQNCLEILRRRGCKTALISSAKPQPEFDYYLRIPPLEDEQAKILNCYSQTSISYILNCIYGLVYALDFASSRAYRDEVKRLTLMDG